MRPFRKERTASVIREIVSETIARKMNDPRMEPLTTITRVEMSHDLLIARIFLSVPGGPAAEKRTIAAVQHASKFVQRQVAREINIRQCPEIRFELDLGIKLAKATLDLIEENRKELGIVEAQEVLDSTDPASSFDRNTCYEDQTIDHQQPDASNDH